VILTAASIICEFSFVIVDESSYIKGHRSARTNWITDLSRKARYRLILTGTPLSQGVVDLYSQMRFLHEGILGYRSFYSFAHNHLEYSEKYPGMIVRAHNTEWLAAKIQPYVYQVTKEQCLTLPDKLYETRWFGMTGEQRDAYDRAKEEMLLEIDPDGFDSITIFRLFGVLQQIVSGFWNRREKENPGFLEFSHRRIDALLDVLDRIPCGEKTIIWAKFRYDIESIRAEIEGKYGAGCSAIFFGDISERDRNREVEKFRHDTRFFIATPSCGGHGLTLNEAAYVIFYNNGFKYSERIQAEDRNHRIGQARPVTYIDLACHASIDERIAAALAKKGNVVQEFKAQVDRVKGKKAKLEDLVRGL
jgi:SNF2 family DNA or RNA helicase